MALGLVPAAEVGFQILAGLIALAVAQPGNTVAVTPFADGWPAVWATVIRIAIGSALVGATLVLVAVSFTALTLVVGEPFYDRIWRAVEADFGVTDPGPGIGFWRGVVDGLLLFARGVGVAVVAALIGLLPAVGGILATVFAVVMTGRLLADELTARAISARGFDRAERRRMLRGHRARALGFGVATQLCFLVPIGAIATMPAAVAGATLLSRDMLARR
jgi:CysZ protein